jgi:hypothetical protein
MPNVFDQFDTEANPFDQFDQPGRTLTATELESGPSDPVAQAEIRRQMAGGEKPFDIYGAPKTSPESMLAQMKGAFSLPTDVLGAAGGAIEKIVEPPLKWAYNKLPTVVQYPSVDEDPLGPTGRAIEAEELKGTDIPPLRGAAPQQPAGLSRPRRDSSAR